MNRYCGACERLVKRQECEHCGADTDPWPKDDGDEATRANDAEYRERERQFKMARYLDEVAGL